MFRFGLAIVSFGVLLASQGIAQGGSCCDLCGNKCKYKMVAKTIQVPITITETRMKTCVIKNMVEKEETYTAFKRVPVKQTYEKETCYLEDEIKTQTITEQKCKRVKNQVVREEAVRYPVQEIRHGTRQREVCTECGKVCVEEPCTCCINKEERGMQTRCYEVDDVVFEKTTKEISYCVKTPKKRKEFCAEETTYKLEPVEKTRKVCVCVPEITKKPVEVQVTKYYPKTIYCCEKCREHGRLAQLGSGVHDKVHGVANKVGEKVQKKAKKAKQVKKLLHQKAQETAPKLKPTGKHLKGLMKLPKILLEHHK